MTAAIHTLCIAGNAQPDIETDTIALYRMAEAASSIKEWTEHGRTYRTGTPHVHHKNGGVKHVFGNMSPAFAAQVRALGSLTRQCKGYVKVSPPKALVAEVARLDVQWQAMAAAGRTDFSSMRVEMMNAAA
jgi:hypothetical protein